MLQENIQTKDDAIKLLSDMVHELNIADCKLGLAGSFAKGTPKKKSDLNIAVDFGDNFNVLILEYRIHDYLKSKTKRDYDIIYIGELLKEKKALLDFGDTEESLGETFYDFIIKDVIWIEKEKK